MPAPEDIAARALLHRAAANILPKSPVWALLSSFMADKLREMEITILNNQSLDPAQLASLRDKRLFLRQTLTDFANNFRSAFTSPPNSDDPGLTKMEVPREVNEALKLLITAAEPIARPPQPPPVAKDPKDINPFELQPK